MDFLELIRSRQSIRSFLSTPIPQETLTRIVKTAQESPSAGNLQPCEYIVCTDPDMIQKIGSAGFQEFLQHVPALIVVLINKERTEQKYGERGSTLYVFQDSGAAIHALLLSASQEGLGSLWCGAFRENIVVESLSLPPNYRPVGLIALGIPAKITPKPTRRSLDEILHWNAFP